MKPHWIWISLGALSLLWAGAAWAGYELFDVMVGVMPAVTHWLTDFPALQLLWESGVNLLGGLNGVVQLLAWILWGIGQAALLVLAWVGLKYVPAHTLANIRTRLLQQRPHQRW